MCQHFLWLPRSQVLLFQGGKKTEGLKVFQFERKGSAKRISEASTLRLNLLFYDLCIEETGFLWAN